MRKWFVVLPIFVLWMCSCDEGKEPIDEISSLVVEGWIEDGGFPVVIVTKSMPVNEDYRDYEDLNEYLVKWARVTVTDGTDTVVLTGKYDAGYFPPFIYTTSRLRGHQGGHYTLTVEYGDLCATATTMIPSNPLDCQFKVERCTGSDTLFQIIASFSDNPHEKNYYQFFTRVGATTKQYLASYLGSVDDAVLGDKTEMPVYRGHKLSALDYTPYYFLGDTVLVKFTQVDEDSYRFWDGFTKILSLSGNMFLSSDSHLESNIQGGLGYWCGYTAVTDYIVIADSVR